MKKLLLAATLLAGVSASANAAVTVNFDEGMSAAGSSSVFEDFDDGTADGFVLAGGAVVQSGSNGVGADPNNITVPVDAGDPYLTTPGGATATFTFDEAVSSFFFDYGSADAYNTFTLYLAGGGTAVYTGDMVALPANGGQFTPNTNGLLTFTGTLGTMFTGFQLASSQNSLEIDNLGTPGAVPEPATWAFMLIGFGAVGYAMRRRPTFRRTQVA